MSISSQGIKKPMNQLNNPVFPDIKKAPPRFTWSRKHWNVDVGATMRDTEAITQFRENAVLAQARDYNQTVYGKSSFQDKIVNFRPPLLDPIEDFFPANRIPVTSRAITPRINPTTASDAGTSGYLAKNERISDIESHLTDRLKHGEWRPTFYCPIEVPQDNSILPDLEMTIPSVSASAGFKYQTIDAPAQEVHLSHEQFDPQMDAGFEFTFRKNGESGLENITLYDNRPSVSASSGITTDLTIDGDLSGLHNTDLHLNRPDVSVTAGTNTPMQAINIETPIGELDYKRPQAAVSAGMNTPYEINGDMSQHSDINLETQLTAPLNIGNPGSEHGYQSEVNLTRDPNEYIMDKRPSYSYQVHSETETGYRARNEMSYQPGFHTPLQPEKSYGQIAQSGGYYPRKGIEMPRKMTLRGAGGWANTPKIKNYSFGRRS